jgi:hypothetical protein
LSGGLRGQGLAWGRRLLETWKPTAVWGDQFSRVVFIDPTKAQLDHHESLWGSLKVGRPYGKRFATQLEAIDEVIDWPTFYNHWRLHSTLGYISSMKLEENRQAGQANKTA